MKEPRSRPATSKPIESIDVDSESLDAGKLALLDKNFRESQSAFFKWETAQGGTDRQLYQAIGRLAEFAAVIGNDHVGLTQFAASKGLRTTKASSTYSVIAKLVVTSDRRKASKYATVLHLAARKGVATSANEVAAFIQAEGGIEACLKRSRELVRENKPATRRGRPSAFSQAVQRIAQVGRSPAPADLTSGTPTRDYVLIVGVRGEDGTLQLLHEPVTEEGLVRKAIATLKPKS